MDFHPPVWHDEFDSTNLAMKRRLEAGEALPAGFVLGARAQTRGRGRQGRGWLSVPGKDLTFSVLLRTSAAFPQLASLPIAVALGVAEALDRYGLRAATKWPNDVLIERKKIAGILSQRCPVDNEAFVVGIGLNVNMNAGDAARIDQPATSLLLETGRDYPVEEVLAHLLPHIGIWFDRWRDGGFAAIGPAWDRRVAYLHEAVTVRDGAQQRSGVLAGFGHDGELLLEEPSGEVRQVWTGDLGHWA